MVPSFVFSLASFCFWICCSRVAIRCSMSCVVTSYCCLSCSSCFCKSSGFWAAGCCARDGRATVATNATIHGTRLGWSKLHIFLPVTRSVAGFLTLSSARGTPLQYELLHCFGESFLFVCGSDVSSRCLNFGARVSHRNAHAALLEHQDVIGHISDGRDLLRGNVQEFRHCEHHPTLVGLGMGHIKVVGLRTRRGNMRPAGLLNILLTFRNALVLVANTDNLRHSAKQSRKRLDHRWRKLHGPLLACDVSCIWVAHKPFRVRVYPHIETMALDGLN